MRLCDYKKQGVDISNIPRKTTNIIERFQQAYEGFGVDSKKDSQEVQKAYRSNFNDDDGDKDNTDINGANEDSTEVLQENSNDNVKTTSEGRRKSKKEVLKVCCSTLLFFSPPYGHVHSYNHMYMHFHRQEMSI